MAAWREPIDRAVRGTNIPPALLEGLVFLESAGDPQALAGTKATDAAGLTQILAGTGQSMLGMRINLRRSQTLTKRRRQRWLWPATNAKAWRGARTAAERGSTRASGPEPELAATVRYLLTAEVSLGHRPDLSAVAAYHAGIGNVEQLLTLFDGGSAVP